MCVFLWCVPDLIMSHLPRKTAPLSQLSRVTCTLFHFCWHSVIGCEVIVRYNWWSYHSVLSCISRFSDCGANTKRWQQEKKARGWGRKWERNDLHRPPPALPLSLLILFCSLTWHHTPLRPGIGTSQFCCSMLCHRCSAVNLLFKSLAFQFLDALLC